MPTPLSGIPAALGADNPQNPQNPPTPPTPAPPPQVQPAEAGQQIQPQPMQNMPIDPSTARAIKTHAGWNALMGTHEEVGPGGTTTQQQNTPGQFFRSILAGAILGAATGASHAKENEGSGLAAGAEGAEAAFQQNRQQRQEVQQQSQQQFENQQKQAQADREKNLVDAQMAHMQAQQVVWQHQNDIMDKTYHDQHNAAAQTLLDKMTEAGGVPPVNGALPEHMTATELQQAFTKDPTIRQAPEGYVRHFFDKTDASELTWDDKAGNWVTADGTPANMTDKSVITVMDVPRNAMTVKSPISGADITKIAGQNLNLDPSKTYLMSPIDLVNLYQNNLKAQTELARTKAADRAAKVQARANELEALRQTHAEFDAHRQVIMAKKESLQKQLDALKNDLSATPQDKQTLVDQIAQQDQLLDELANEEYPRDKKAAAEVKTVTPSPGPKATPEAKAISETVSKFAQQVTPSASGSFMTAANALQNGLPLSDVLSQLASASSISPEDKTVLASVLPKFYAEISPVMKKTKQQSQAATQAVQAAASTADKAEHPVLSAVGRTFLKTPDVVIP